MLSAIKMVGLTKVVSAKALAAKALFGASILLGSAATGYVAITGMPLDYVDSVNSLISNAVATEGLGAAPDLNTQPTHLQASATYGPE